ncbi:hypothetical protein Mboo_0969 [Methanoregula boonei 6A8]|jgi:hypothetical protein|uniref:Uncharacterized protein n=1 Tax=Methanoregula boonei (strain DSM 21154 / JCM 14090 / 6A8) TaxID=456442 RepID=A7I6X6_METB6|nr:hypothetical protein [Methanoregula boonei]ABS55487.1 hypothetical protein Mboo_0969 [Methanoregula boonei 6A8]
MSTRKLVFSLGMGIVYPILGIVQILGGIVPGLAVSLNVLFIPADIIQGFVLCLIGAVFLYGAAEIHQNRPGAEAFLYVGMLLSLIFCVITLIDLGAQGANAVLFGGDGGSSWPLTQVIIPIIYMAVPSVIGSYAWGRKFFSDLTEA